MGVCVCVFEVFRFNEMSSRLIERVMRVSLVSGRHRWRPIGGPHIDGLQLDTVARLVQLPASCTDHTKWARARFKLVYRSVEDVAGSIN